jgi:D-ribose pyranase
MKKTELINSEISEVIAKMGHTDLLAIGDSGLPIPDGVRRIDIALTKGIPTFRDTLNSVLSELGFEKIYIAEEMKDKNKELYAEMISRFEDKIAMISHEELKSMTRNAKAVVRTGEYKPYANVVIQSGVEF